MFVFKFLIVTFIVYIVLTRFIPACIGAYYGSKLWKKYVSFYSILSKDTVDSMFRHDVQMHVLNHPYVRFLTKF